MRWILAVLLSGPIAAGLWQSDNDMTNPRVLFAVRERLHPHDGPVTCAPGKLVAYRLDYSELKVFTDRVAELRAWSVPPCSKPEDAFAWNAPAGGAQRFSIPPDQFDQLKRFLDEPEVKSLTDFMAASEGAGDYEIEIERSSGTQKILVLGLTPTQRDATLVRVICEAKELAGDERPSWCTE